MRFYGASEHLGLMDVRWHVVESQACFLFVKTMKLKVILEASDDGGYTVFVPSLPGCISEGETREEALANIQEAIDLYLELDEEGT